MFLHRGGAAGGADEVADAGRFLDEEEDVLGDAAVVFEAHFNEDVAGVELGLGDLDLVVLGRLGLLGGDDDASDQVAHVLDLDLAQQRVLDGGFLVAGDAEDEPVHAFLAHGFIGAEEAGTLRWGDGLGFLGGVVYVVVVHGARALSYEKRRGNAAVCFNQARCKRAQTPIGPNGRCRDRSDCGDTQRWRTPMTSMTFERPKSLMKM